MSEDQPRYEAVMTRYFIAQRGDSIHSPGSLVVDLDKCADGQECLTLWSPGQEDIQINLDNWPALFVAIETMLKVLRERASPGTPTVVPPDKVAEAIAACWAVTAEDLSDEGGQALTDLAMATGRLANLASAERVGRKGMGDFLV